MVKMEKDIPEENKLFWYGNKKIPIPKRETRTSHEKDQLGEDWVNLLKAVQNSPLLHQNNRGN